MSIEQCRFKNAMNKLVLIRFNLANRILSSAVEVNAIFLYVHLDKFSTAAWAAFTQNEYYQNKDFFCVFFDAFKVILTWFVGWKPAN